MRMTNCWLAGLSLVLSGIGTQQNNLYAVRIGILCLLCVLLAQLLTPQHPANRASRWTLYLSRVCALTCRFVSGCCILFMVVLVIDQIISNTSLLVPVIDVAWDIRTIPLSEVLR